MAELIYHKCNFLKFRIAQELFNSYPNRLSCIDLSDRLGVPSNHISKSMTHYRKTKQGHFNRRKIKGSKAYSYQLNERGRKLYTDCLGRIKLGVDLNRNRATPVKMSTYSDFKSVKIKTPEDLILTTEQLIPYLGIKRGGVEKGYTKEDMIRIAGLLNEFEEEEPEPEKEEEDEEEFDKYEVLNEEEEEEEEPEPIKVPAQTPEEIVDQLLAKHVVPPVKAPVEIIEEDDEIPLEALVVSPSIEEMAKDYLSYMKMVIVEHAHGKSIEEKQALEAEMAEIKTYLRENSKMNVEVYKLIKAEKNQMKA